MKATVKTKQIVESISLVLSREEADTLRGLFTELIDGGNFDATKTGVLIDQIHNELNMALSETFTVPKISLSGEDRDAWLMTKGGVKVKGEKLVKVKKPKKTKEIPPEKIEEVAEKIGEYFAPEPPMEDDVPSDGHKIGKVLNILHR